LFPSLTAPILSDSTYIVSRGCYQAEMGARFVLPLSKNPKDKGGKVSFAASTSAS
jgi:hypothetical protein